MQCRPEKEERKKKMFAEKKAVERPSKAAPHVCCTDSGSMHVGLITKIPLETEFWKMKTPKICFQFHNSSLKNQRIE